MLRTRVITAVVLLALIAMAVIAGPTGVAAAAAAVFAVALFEWLRLAGHAPRACAAAALLFGGALLATELAQLHAGRGALTLAAAGAAAIWMVLLLILLQVERNGVRVGRGTSTVLAMVLLTAAWLALMALYREGVVWLLSTLAIVWLADVAAYFGGRAFGRRRLAPRISPGKTWAGVVAAIAAVLVAAELVAMLWPTADVFSSRLLQAVPWYVALLLLSALVALSIVGDLFESLLKRQAGVKDSGRTLPGHGGVLDRIDALLPVMPAAVLIQQWIR
jgi:phosphatidate cytidylyltransferase